jgi:hypothetical protein
LNRAYGSVFAARAGVRAAHARRYFLDAIAGDRAVTTRSRLLDETMKATVNTAFGRAHGFAHVASLHDYRHAVPLRHHEELEPLPCCSTTEAPVEIRPDRKSFVAPWLSRLQQVIEDDSARLCFLSCYAALHDLHNIPCLHHVKRESSRPV